jgi:hypothetical protein
MKVILNFTLFISLFALLSCGANCENVEITKVEWITKDTIVTVDTLVSYSIEKIQTEMADYYSSEWKTRYSVTVRNENKSFSNSFALKYDYQYYNSYSTNWENRDNALKYNEISPNDSWTFSFTRTTFNRDKSISKSDFNSSITILQQPKRVSVTRRIDRLIEKDTIVNTCSVNVEALKMKYAAIRKLYNEKVKQQTDSLKENVIYEKRK